ncbi:MAG: FTR1 family protein, partial [Gammaproteobacteria bacterium]|nr:FTR1 family protein [Gammaproteobacteria bacterium]
MNGIAASGTQSASMWMGGALGIAGGVALGVVLYFGLARIPLKQLFSVSGILILLLAASLSSQSAAYLVQADVLPALIPVVWDSSAILSQSSLLGEILHTLVGYEARPMGIQLIFYFFTFVLIGGLMWWVNRGLKKPATTSAAPAVISAIVVVTLLQFGVSHSAMAGSFIYSPIVDQGEWEYEVKSERLIDKDNSIDGESVLKPSIGYGVNAFWFTEVYGEYEIKADGEREYEATAWENIFQLTAQGEYFVDLGIAAEYEFAAESYNNDKMELKLLMEKSINRATFTANYGVERYFGSGASNEVEHGASFRAKWRQSQAFEPGVEVFSELGDIDQQRSLGNYSQRVGPVFTGSKRMSNTSKFAYEAGYLFGLNDNSPEGTMKLMLEYEFIY